MLASGRSGTLTARDEQILTDLYLTSYLTTGQIASMHFDSGSGPSEAAAYRRLYRIAPKGHLFAQTITTPEGGTHKVWCLTEEGFEREHRHLSGGIRPEKEALLTPKSGRLEHFLSTCEVYCRAAPMLRRYLGEPDLDEEEGWSWRHEYRCGHQVTLGDRERRVKPDGEAVILGTTLYLESQTKRSHASAERMVEKVDAYAMFFKHVLKDREDRHQLLVLTGESAVARAVEEKGNELGILVVGGNLEKLVEHMEDTTYRLSS